MADYVGFSIRFEAPFGPDTLRTFFETLRAAVRENWDRHRDALSWPRTGGEDIDADALVAGTTPETMRPGIIDPEDLSTEDWITFAFGPLSTYVGLLTVGRDREGKLYAFLSVCDSEMRRDDADRLKLRQEFEPDFRDPRLLPEPTLDTDDLDSICEHIDRMEEVWQENEQLYNRYYRDQYAVWAVSAACLRHIFDRLCEALPVASSRMDEEIRVPASTHRA